MKAERLCVMVIAAIKNYLFLENPIHRFSWIEYFFLIIDTKLLYMRDSDNRYRELLKFRNSNSMS